MKPLPRIEHLLLRRLLHSAERDEVIAEMAEEYRHRVARDGPVHARVWVWRQIVMSAPAMVRRSWFRGTTGFESEANRMSGGEVGLETLVLDTRFAMRVLKSRPMYVLLSVVTLALGIGATTGIFGIVRSVLLNPLPYEQSDELEVFWNTFDWSESEFAFLRDDWSGFSSVAAFTHRGVFLKRDGAPARLLPGLASSAELFGVLGARPFIGRTFDRGADAIGAEPTAVISYGLWKELGGSSHVVGSIVRFGGEPRRVIGVMPKGFWFPDPTVRVWLSTPMRPDNDAGNYALIGRIGPGRTEASMRDALRNITSRLARQYTYSAQWDKTKNARLTPVREYLLGPVRPALGATLAGMAVILLMACANVATLMLGQLRGRSSELAVRMALGASRRRVTQQLLVECTMLGLLSGIIGAAVARFGFRILLSALPLGKLGDAATADWSLFGIALVIAVVTALVIAMAPVFSLWRGDLRQALSRVRSGGIGAHGGRLEDAIVIGEVALAVLLASTAAVFIRSVDRLHAVDPGVRARGVAVVDIAVSGEIPSAQRWQHVDNTLSTLRALRGVKAVAATNKLPVRGGGWNFGIEVEGKPDLEASTTAYRIVSRDYFDALGIKLKRGRLFDTSDRAESEPAVIIDENLARKYFEGEDPIGRRITHGMQPGWARIVGVVSNVAHAGLTDGPGPGRYMLYDQVRDVSDGASLVLRVEGDHSPVAVFQEARDAIEHADPNVAVQKVTTMDDILALAMGPTRRIMQLMTLLGALALTLGAVGVYGVVSHFVNRRRRDWVIRMALGMKPLMALRQVVGRGATLVAIGCVIGLVASIALTRLFKSLLYQVDAADPTALLAAAATLILTGCLAALVPAVRASRANAAQVLREST